MFKFDILKILGIITNGNQAAMAKTNIHNEPINKSGLNVYVHKLHTAEISVINNKNNVIIYSSSKFSYCFLFF